MAVRGSQWFENVELNLNTTGIYKMSSYRFFKKWTAKYEKLFKTIKLYYLKKFKSKNERVKTTPYDTQDTELTKHTNCFSYFILKLNLPCIFDDFTCTSIVKNILQNCQNDLQLNMFSHLLLNTLKAV